MPREPYTFKSTACISSNTKIIIALELGAHAVISSCAITADKFFNSEFVVTRTDQMKGSLSIRTMFSPLEEDQKKVGNH